MFTNLTTIPSKVRLGLNATDKKVTIEGFTLQPFYSLRVRAINQEGFSWGDNSAGTLQLALALLLHFTDIETAILLYKEFARQFVSTWKFKGTAIIKLNMRAIIAGLLEEHKILEVF